MLSIIVWRARLSVGRTSTHRPLDCLLLIEVAGQISFNNNDGSNDKKTNKYSIFYDCCYFPRTHGGLRKPND